jgi:NAD(P)-dependent dehydrogenase (short-subunit alcohol dehydrogenase family)
MLPPFPAPVTEWHNDTYPAIHPTRPELSQAGRTIVVSGAGSGIGREVVHAFAQAGAGIIHLLGRTKATLEETRKIVNASHSSIKVEVHVADVADDVAVTAAADKIGSWDVLVANAGYIPSPEFIAGSNAEEWWKTFEVRGFRHTTPCLELTRYRHRLMSRVATCSPKPSYRTRRVVAQL